MKIKITILNLVVLVFLFCIPACKNNENINLAVKQKVCFSFEQKELKVLSSTRQKVIASKADARFVVVTIVNTAGVKVYDTKKLELFNFNGSFISESLTLDVADYKLTSFLVLDANNSVIYSTPLEGAPLATQVADPLPISFTVTKDQETKIIPDVLAATGAAVSDFGYASFDFDVMIPFRISAQTYDSVATGWTPTSADIAIVGIDTKVGTLGDIPLDSVSITNKTNIISIKDGYPYYGISVRKTSYIPQFIILTNAQLKAYLNTPIQFSLISGGTVTDIEGNVYKVVTIGTQTWMAENLRVTKYRDGTTIPHSKNNAAGGWCDGGDDPANGLKYGKLYNWYVVINNRNIAPVGWHVPSDAEWTKLTAYFPEGNCAKSLASTTDWISVTGIGSVGCNPALNNSSGFCALPAGTSSSSGTPIRFGDWTCWLTSDGWTWSMYKEKRSNTVNGMAHINSNFNPGYSIRCIKDY